ASSAPATQRTPSRRSWANSFEPLERRRGFALTATPDGPDVTVTPRMMAQPGGGIAARDRNDRLKQPEALRRPVGREGPADDPLLGHRAPEAGVVRRAAVVAHHEPHPLRDRDLALQRAVVAGRARADVAVLLALAVADHVAVED